MRSNRDKRSDSEREIDEFLSQFETPVDELSADVNSYLNQTDTTRMTAARTFYGKEFSDAGSEAEDIADSVVPELENAMASAAADNSADQAAATESASVAAVPASDAGAAAGKKKKKKASGKKKAKKAAAKKQKKKLTGKEIAAKLFLKPNPKYDPAKGRSSGNKPMKLSIKNLFLDLVMLGVIFLFCGLIYALGCITFAPHYDFTDIYSAVDTSSMIYDDEGKQVDSVYYTQNRKVVKYEDMPEDLINSFIAIEDKTFWKHHGFNWTRMIGAVLSSFTGHGRISGTSTITQQLARNVYLSDIKSQRSIRRKIIEMYYASRIEHALSKEQIVEAYLNTIYLGYGCYGVDAASRIYFSKKVKNLDLVECAALAALPQAPEDYALLKLADSGEQVSDDSKIVARDPDTIVTNDTARGRRQLTLRLMLDQGYIDQSEYDETVDKTLNSFIDPTIKSGNGIYSYFHEYLVETVIQDLMDKYGMEYADAERMVYTKGLQIYSTLDKKAQKVVATEFQNPDNFPSVSAIYNTDADGNMLNNDGDIALYNYDHFFDEDGNFILSGDDVKFKKDGSVVIKKGRDLNIYETEVNGAVDYSLEFKNYYRIIDDKLYSIQGGYVNIPSTYKSANSKGNLVISADYFTDPAYEGDIEKDGDRLIITDEAYSLASRTLQPQGAMVIVGVGTGEVKAMVGGRTFKGQKLLNRAVNARQPGSSIKPLSVYGAALQKSYDLAAKNKKWSYTDFKIDKQGTKGWGDYVTVHSSIQDERTHIEGKDWPDNVTKSFSGKNTFKSAIQKSINTCAVKLQLQVGTDYSMDQLKKFGITTAVDDEKEYANDLNPAALALGAMCQGVKPLEMALAYASFPGEGKVNTPVCYTKVVDRNGEVILEGKSEQTEAMDPGVAWIMRDVLNSVVNANGYIHLDNDIKPGGKTGTTNDRYDIWFDGFTPSYAAALWIGTDNNVEMASGSLAAAHLWGLIMNQIPKALKGSYVSQPSNVIQKGGEYFTKGTENGLSSYQSPEEAKKERERQKKEAYEKWKRQRDKHKVWVVDKKGHYEEKEEVITVVDKEAWDETIEEEVDDYETDPETGEKIKVGSHTETTVIHHPAETHEEVKKTKIWIEEKGHWEYEKGWRDGDFKY